MTISVYDQAARYDVKLDPLGFLRWLITLLAETVEFRDWLDTRSIPFPGDPDRTGDLVACLTDTSHPAFHWAVAVEFQSRPDLLMFGRVLEYLARIWIGACPAGVEREHFGVVALVVNLTGAGTTERSFRLGKTALQTCLRVNESDLALISASRTLKGIGEGRITRAVLSFVPLLRGGGQPAIIARWKELAQAEPDERRRADYGGLALVFSELAGCRPAWKQALEGWGVEQSQQVLEWQAQAFTKGKAEGKAEGKVEGKADSLLRFARQKFNQSVPADLAATIRACTDLDELDRWLDALGTVSSMEELRHRIQS